MMVTIEQFCKQVDGLIFSMRNQNTSVKFN